MLWINKERIKKQQSDTAKFKWNLGDILKCWIWLLSLWGLFFLVPEMSILILSHSQRLLKNTNALWHVGITNSSGPLRVMVFWMVVSLLYSSLIVFSFEWAGEIELRKQKWLNTVGGYGCSEEGFLGNRWLSAGSGRKAIHLRGKKGTSQLCSWV